MKITDATIRRAEPRARPFKLFDGGGLHVLVNPNGSKLWRLKYRFRGIERQASFGAWPAVSLKMARQKRDEFRRILASGDDPMKPRRGVSFEQVALEWLAGRRVDYEPAYPGHITRRLKRHVFPFIGSRPIAVIDAPELLSVLRRIKAREMAGRVRATCGQIFRFGVASGYCSRDIAADLRDALAPHKTKHHAALPLHELRGFITDIRASNELPVIRLGLLFLAHTAVRASEMTGATWTELDLEERLWLIPAKRMKMKREHLVPLSFQALRLLDELQAINDDRLHVFASPINRDRPISNNALLRCLHRRGFKGRMTCHGFRACFSTAAHEAFSKNEHDAGPLVIEKQLAHCSKNEIAAAYNRAEYLPARRDLMDWYSDHLEGEVRLLYRPGESPFFQDD